MEECQRCHEAEEDRRTLWMACFYEMGELDLPFEKRIMQDKGAGHTQLFYTMRVCKDCRSDWMKAIQYWFHDVEPEPKPKPCGSGIYVREFGANVEISEEEWQRRHPGIEPVRFKG